MNCNTNYYAAKLTLIFRFTKYFITFFHQNMIKYRKRHQKVRNTTCLAPFSAPGSQHQLGEEAAECGVEVGGDAGMHGRRAQTRTLLGGEPAKTLLDGAEGYRPGLGQPGGDGAERIELTAQTSEGDFAAEGREATLVDIDLEPEPAATLAHHGQSDVDKLPAFDTGHIAHYGVFI